MSGHLLASEYFNATAIQLPPLAIGAAAAWWMIGTAFALITCGLIYGHLLRLRKNAAQTLPAPAKRPPTRSPFDELVEAHKLDTAEVTILREATQQFELEQPVLLFVDPTLLSRFCQTNPSADALRKKLFGSSKEPADLPTDQQCSDLQTSIQEPENSPCQPEVDRSVSIDTVAEDLLGELPPAASSQPAEILERAGVETAS